MCKFVLHNALCFHDTNSKEKMIPKGFVRREQFHKLTKEEAKAFLLFLTMEAERHKEDIKTIEEDIRYVRRIHKI